MTINTLLEKKFVWFDFSTNRSGISHFKKTTVSCHEQDVQKWSTEGYRTNLQTDRNWLQHISGLGIDFDDLRV